MLVELIIQQEIQLSFWERAFISVGSKHKIMQWLYYHNSCREFLNKICVKTCPDGEKHICATDEDVS